MRSSTGYPPIPKVKLVIAGQWEPHGNGRVLRLYFTPFRFERLRRGSGMEFVLAWILGFVLTSGFVVSVFAKLFHRHVLKPLLLPLELVKRLIAIDNASAHKEAESCAWLNSLTSWLHLHLIRPIPAIYAARRRKQSETVVDLRRNPIVGPFLVDAELVDYDAGGELPRVSRMRTLTRPSKEHPDSPLAFAVDVEYEGGLGFAAKLQTVFSDTTPTYLTMRMRRIKARMLIVFRKNAYYFGFVPSALGSTAYRLSYELESTLAFGGYKVRGLDSLLSRFLMRRAFEKRFVVPSMKAKWWIDKPKQPLYPWEDEALANPEALFALPT